MDKTTTYIVIGAVVAFWLWKSGKLSGLLGAGEGAQDTGPTRTAAPPVVGGLPGEDEIPRKVTRATPARVAPQRAAPITTTAANQPGAGGNAAPVGQPIARAPVLSSGGTTALNAPLKLADAHLGVVRAGLSGDVKGVVVGSAKLAVTPVTVPTKAAISSVKTGYNTIKKLF